LKAFKGFADTQQVIIKKTLPGDPLVVGFDPDKMEKILFNLYPMPSSFHLHREL